MISLPNGNHKISSKTFKDLVDFIYDLLIKKISYDSTKNQVKVVARLPWDKAEIDETIAEPKPEDDICYLRTFVDTDILETKRLISATQKIEFGVEDIMNAILLTAKRNSVNPLEKYLTSITKESTNYLDRWLVEFCGAYGPSERIIRLIGRKFILGMVKRALFPGTKFDTMLIIEGPQGIGKSQLCRILAGNPNYYSEEIVNLRDSRAIIEAYAGKMLVEIGELSSFTRSDQKILKQFLSKTEDTARAAYGRFPMTIPRTFSFVGTTNEDHYLMDDTGARRFWPISTDRIDLELMRDIIDHLLAEAIELAIHTNEKIWLDWEDEKELTEFRNSKLSIYNEDLAGFVKANYDTLLYYRNSKGLISFERIREWVRENEEIGKVADKDLSLLLQKIGATQHREVYKRVWKLPERFPDLA